MFRIGFSKKFFTLWKVTEKKAFEEVDGISIPFKKIEKRFIKNLSSEEGLAKRKAIFEGVENFEIDFGLCGIKFLNDQYSEKSNDELFFLYCETRTEFLKELLLRKGFKNEGGQIVYTELSKKINLRNLVKNEVQVKGEIKVNILSNLNNLNEFRFEIKNEVFHGIFDGESKLFRFKGNEFYLPIIDGKAKRIKNKTAKLSVGKFEADVYQIKKIEKLRNEK